MPIRADVNKIFKFDPVTGKYNTVRWRRSLKPYDLYPKSLPDGAAMNFPAPTATRRFEWRPDASSNNWLDDTRRTPFLIQALTYVESQNGFAAADFTVMLRQIANGRQLMNRPCHLRTIAGSQGTPFLLRTPLLFPANSAIIGDFVRLGAGVRDLRFFMSGVLICPWANELVVDEHWRDELKNMIAQWNNWSKYVIPYWATQDEDEIELTANQTADFYYTNADDSCLEIFGVNAVSDGNFAFEISEPQTNQSLQNGVVTNTNACGLGTYPSIWPTTYLLYPGYTLRIRVTDLSGAGNTVFFTMFGTRIYAKPAEYLTVTRDLKPFTPASDGGVAPAPYHRLPYGTPKLT